MGRRPPNKTDPPSRPSRKTTPNTTTPKPAHHKSPTNATTASTNATNPATTPPPPDISDLLSTDVNVEEPPRERITYAQYLEGRSKHLDELDATYQSWQSSSCPQTLFELALVHINGLHPAYPPNAEAALKYLQLAAAQDHSDAAAYIALFHLGGLVFPESAETASAILHTRADAGCLPSMYWLSLVHLLGSKSTIESSAGLDRLLLTTPPFNPGAIRLSSDEEALKLLHTSAELGYHRAQDHLIWCYLSGDSVGAPSFDQALHWATKFSQSTNQMRFKNNGAVSLHLRDALAYIDSVDQVDDSELTKLLTPACDEGSAHAFYLLGLLYQKKFNDSDVHARFLFLQAAVRGSPQGQYQVGRYQPLEGASDYNTIVHWLEKAAKEGNRDAIDLLAQIYHEGSHVAKNINKTAQLYLYAAQRGQHSAHATLATLYQTGDGVPKSFHLAAELLIKAINIPLTSVANEIKHVSSEAAAQHADVIGFAQERLGQLYLSGDPATGFPACPVTALKYYQLAAEGGQDVKYQTQLGRLLSPSGDLPPELRDPEASIKWFTVAANQNDVRAQEALANALQHGVGVKHDIPGAVVWWRKAFDLDSSKAAYYLGKFLYDGDHPHIVLTNKQEGIRLLKIAAEQTSANQQVSSLAQIELAFIYHQTGALPQAEKWYSAAAAQSNTMAMAMHGLAQLYHYTPNYVPTGMTQKQVDLLIMKNYSEAANGGYLHANLNLAKIHLAGFRSIPKHREKALTFLAACINGDPNVKNEPSDMATKACYELGRLAQNTKIARLQTCLRLSSTLEWWTFGAHHGDNDCQVEIATMYYEGKGGLKQDYSLASQWLHQCLKQGHHKSAISLLGKMQHRGVFVRPPESDEDE